jgi:hypothetical protein
MDDDLQLRARAAGPVAGLLIGAVGAALLSVVTSQGFLHATVVTGAGYTGKATELDPLGQLAMVLAWLTLGAVAGFVGRTHGAFAGLWIGTLAGSAVGFVNDPAGNVLWLDIIVTVVGISLFVTPGFFVGSVLAASRERLAPDGSGRRPTPPPLWTRGARTIRGPQSIGPGPTRPAAPAAPASYPASAYARPGSQQPE